MSILEDIGQRDHPPCHVYFADDLVICEKHTRNKQKISWNGGERAIENKGTASQQEQDRNTYHRIPVLTITFKLGGEKDKKCKRYLKYLGSMF